jgi:hypothetical protein
MTFGDYVYYLNESGVVICFSGGLFTHNAIVLELETALLQRNAIVDENQP